MGMFVSCSFYTQYKYLYTTCTYQVCYKELYRRCMIDLYSASHVLRFATVLRLR